MKHDRNKTAAAVILIAAAIVAGCILLLATPASGEGRETGSVWGGSAGSVQRQNNASHNNLPPDASDSAEKSGTLPTSPGTGEDASDSAEGGGTWTRYDVPLEDELQRYIYEVCREYGVDMPLVLAIIERESGYDPDQIGDEGRSYGLMQVMASEHTERCIRLGAVRLLEPRQNILAGVDYLAELFTKDKPIEWVLMAYHGGEPYAIGQERDGVRSTAYVSYVLARAEEIETTEEVMV